MAAAFVEDREKIYFPDTISVFEGTEIDIHHRQSFRPTDGVSNPSRVKVDSLFTR